MKTLHTYEDRAKCYACDARAVGARTFHPVGEVAQAEEAFERGDRFGAARRPAKYKAAEGLIAPACARHADTQVRIVACCSYCTGPAPRGLVVDGRVAHVACERDDVMA